MKNFKNRFQVKDSITQLRYKNAIRKGTVVAGPFNVEGVSHYHVKWDWEDKQHGTPELFKQEVNLICDMVSTKYMYV